jgi:hypothetical protein
MVFPPGHCARFSERDALFPAVFFCRYRFLSVLSNAAAHGKRRRLADAMLTEKAGLAGLSWAQLRGEAAVF